MAAGDLTTAAEVIAYLGPKAQADAALIATLVTEASQFIKSYTGNNILSATYTEMRDGVGYDVAYPSYVLQQVPITAVSLVTVDGVVVPAAPIPGPSSPIRTGYVFSATKLVIFGWVPRIPLCVTIQYTAGFATVPADLDLACIDLVAQKYRQRTRIGITNEAVTGVGSRAYTNADLLIASKATLDTLGKYTRVAPVAPFIVPAGGIPTPSGPPANSVYFEAAASDETTPLTTGADLLTFRTPYAFTLTAARASLSTAGSSQTAVDVNMNGTSIFSTVLTVDASSRTSIGAAVPPVLSTTAIPDNAEFTVDIDTAGTSATGLKVVLIGTVP